jgi:glycine C-acetyltransferase
LDLLEQGEEGAALRARLWSNVGYFREAMNSAGFTLAGRDHAIIPIMLGDAQLAAEFAKRLAARGILAVGFSFPVVPQGKARIRTQMSAAHTQEQLERAVASMTSVGHELNLVK